MFSDGAISYGAISDGTATPVRFPDTAKILIAGGFGVGKTTMVGTVSEIDPLSTEALLTENSAGTDSLTGIEGKTTTTVALDFGRLTLDEHLKLYLFGTPGQDRFWFLWPQIAIGAIGAVVLIDTRRPEECFPAVDFFESRGVPFVVAVNNFDGADVYLIEDIRDALDVGPKTPVMYCDARRRSDCKDVLVALVQHAIEHIA